MLFRNLSARITRSVRLFCRCVVHCTVATWTYCRTPRFRYLLHDDKVYRVPASVTPDLIIMYLEGVNAMRLSNQCRHRPVNEALSDLLTVDEMMERLGFKPVFKVERLGIEV